MLSQNRKVKNCVPAGSGLLLFLLAFLVINPVSGVAFAEEKAENLSEENNISAQTVAINSTVAIAFSPSSVSASMTPIDSNGAKAKVDVKAIVRVQNSGGYSVYVGSSSSQLKSGANVIDSVTSPTTYENMPVNRWGYSFVKGTVASNTYYAMPATLRGAPADSNSNTNIIDETVTYTLSFAANIGSDKPSGTYTNQVTMSVVSSPLDVANEFGIEHLQDMTTAICNSVAVGTADQLKDARDGKYYWVTKLADNKCWMTQNLDFDLSTSTALTPATSDVSANWTPDFDTAARADDTTILADSTGQRSWSLGDYRITNPTTSNSCGSEKNDLSQCPAQFTTYATPTSQNGDANAHYIVGNFYQWNAATAGSGGSITAGQAMSSICPKGWKLPTSTSSGELSTMVSALSIGADTVKITSSPFYGVRGGSVSQSTSLFSGSGDYGYYWSSTPTSNSNYAYLLRFYGTNSVNASVPAGNYGRNNGFSVRCVAR